MAAAIRDPRANQKQRTRAAIVEAAAGLLRAGKTPTVAEAAEAAMVSRATAYRYFPTPETLLLEIASITPALTSVEALVADESLPSAEERLSRLQQTFIPIVYAEEAQMRTALRVYLDNWLANRGRDAADAPLREGRRMRWLVWALAPAGKTLRGGKRRRLEAALALTLGMEAMIVMKDVCRLEDQEAQAVLRWAAQALLKAGLAEAEFSPPAPPRTARRSSRPARP